jgi:hypothetical protein
MKTIQELEQFLDDDFRNWLSVLTVDNVALWGKMDAQQMVEHLIIAVNVSNGKQLITLATSIEKIDKFGVYVFENFGSLQKNATGEIEFDQNQKSIIPSNVVISDANKDDSVFKESKEKDEIVLDAAIERVLELGIKVDVLLGDFDRNFDAQFYKENLKILIFSNFNYF